MKLEAKDITADKIISIPKYVEQLIKTTGNNKISKNTITYQLKETNNLDFVEIGGKTFIVKNEKSEKFIPGKNYGGKRVMKKISL